MPSCQQPRRQLSRLDSLSLCAGISIFFVASLYVFVPRSVQRLARDDPAQIRWRSLATTIVCVLSLLVSKFISCEDSIGSILGQASLAVLLQDLFSAVVALGHIMVLYLNPLVMTMLRVRRIVNRNNGVYQRGGVQAFLKNYYTICIGPMVAALLRIDGNEQVQWILLRNYIFAPITEELVFRCSIIPVLQAGGMSDGSIIWISPMFFGFAHAHHAFLRYNQGLPIFTVVLQTTFQFAYTTLFGIYCSYVYLRTKSVLAVCVGHAFCNVMGLPNLSFFGPSSPDYSQRFLLTVLLCTGIIGFYLGIVLGVLPQESSRPDRLKTHQH
jgi:membrane protease YdiL (CAAX protease family)